MPEIVIGRDWEDLQKYGEVGTIYFGKHIVGTGEDAHLTSKVLVDVLRPHIIVLTGKRGQGKSYSLGIFLEEIMQLPYDIRSNLCAVMIDTQGIFWTMKSPNEQQLSLLSEWGIRSAGFPINVYVPHAQAQLFSSAGVAYDGVFAIKPSQLSTEDWMNTLDLKFNDMTGILLQKVMDKLRGKDYSLDDVVTVIRDIAGFEKEKMILENYFVAAKDWGVFAETAEAKMPKLLEPGKVSIVDVSLTPQNVRALLISLLSKYILEERVKARRLEELAIIEESKIERIPMCWILIDEAHNFIPPETDPQTAASDVLKKLVKEGRQPGITLVFATQQPNKLHPDALAQCDLVISHRLTAKADIDALRSIMQTYIFFDINKYLQDLPRMKGTAIILDDNSERIYRIRARPRQSWHAGSSPLAMQTK